jgi:hypothetical protein
MLRFGGELSAIINRISPYRINPADRRLMAGTIGERNRAFLTELDSAGYAAETIILAEQTLQIHREIEKRHAAAAHQRTGRE